MPNSQLAPSNRVLFACRTCCSNNIHGLICTWCGGTCDAASSTQRQRRRVSAPHLLTDTQKEQLRLIEQNAAMLSAPLSGLLAEAMPEARAVRRRRHRDAVVYSLDDATGLLRTVKFTVLL